MNRKIVLAVVLLLVSGAGRAWGQIAAPKPPNVTLTFNSDGTVDLAAANVTTRQILAEWARKCGCHVVNAEKLPGGAATVPLLFQHAPQSKVLESLLRPAAGYVLTPRRPGSTSPSNYETIYIVATSAPTANTFAQPAYQPVVAPIVTPGSADDEIPPVVPQPRAPEPTPEATPKPPPTTYGTPGVFVPAPIVPAGPPAPSGPAAGPAPAPAPPPAQTGR